MRAAILDKHGSIDDLRIGEIDPPELTADTILVRVRAASINPADLKFIRGKDGGGFLHAKNFPTAIGFDFSGVVEQRGANAQGARHRRRGLREDPQLPNDQGELCGASRREARLGGYRTPERQP